MLPAESCGRKKKVMICHFQRKTKRRYFFIINKKIYIRVANRRKFPQKREICLDICSRERGLDLAEKSVTKRRNAGRFLLKS